LTTLASFTAFLSIFFVIGLASVFKSRHTKKDYYLAGQSLGPLSCGLSAVATNNSGYMFIGVIGYTYQVGLASIWLLIGWIAGDFLASLFIHKRLRIATTETGEVSFSAVLAKWQGQDMLIWRKLAGLLTLIFLGAYAAAQIAAGSKALEGTLGWNQSAGAWIAAGMIIFYSAAGGIRATIWTDVAQSLVMLLAMAMLVIIGFLEMGGPDKVMQAWQAIPHYLDLSPQGQVIPSLLGLLLFAAGWLVAGLSVIGQPHIMIRFMALNNTNDFSAARCYYYGFFILFYALATAAGMLSRLYFPDLSQLDPEMALPIMAAQLLHPMFVGLFLAGIFAATLSTADSLILSCSSVITHDFMPKKIERPYIIKLNTALVTSIALLIALYGSNSVFDLVIMSWAVMGVAFAPLLILLAINRTVTQILAVSIMLIGVSTSLLWRYLDYNLITYEGLPGIALALTVGWLFSKKRIKGHQLKSFKKTPR